MNQSSSGTEEAISQLSIFRAVTLPASDQQNRQENDITELFIPVPSTSILPNDAVDSTEHLDDRQILHLTLKRF